MHTRPHATTTTTTTTSLLASVSQKGTLDTSDSDIRHVLSGDNITVVAKHATVGHVIVASGGGGHAATVVPVPSKDW